MAPLPHNNTDIWYLDYSIGSHGHTMEMRADLGDDAAAASAAMDAFLSTFEGTYFTITITGFRYQAQGTNVSLPRTWGGASSYGTAGSATEYQTANFATFVGRSTAGRRVRTTLFGFSVVQVGGNYRATPAEIAALQDALDALAATSTAWLAIDGNVPVWNPYANVGINAYWRNQIR